jgi:hypothetical protein
MIFKVLAGLVAATLLLGFLVPYVLKMQDIALATVALIGVVMMARDLWDTFQEKDE